MSSCLLDLRCRLAETLGVLLVESGPHMRGDFSNDSAAYFELDIQ